MVKMMGSIQQMLFVFTKLCLYIRAQGANLGPCDKPVAILLTSITLYWVINTVFLTFFRSTFLTVCVKGLLFHQV